MSTVFLTKYNPDSLFRTGGISQHTSLQTKKTMFNSTFLAQYDSHFNSIQQIYTQNILFKLLQSTLPDAAVTRTVAENLRLKTSKYAYLMDRRAELGDLSLGASSNTSTSINVVLKLLYHYRFKKLRRSSKHLHVFMDQKFSGSGFLKSGRHAPNFRRNIRYGAFVRASVWSFYSGAFLAYSQTGPKSKNFGYVQFTTQNLTKKPSAFFRRNSSFVKFSSGYTRHTLLVVMLSAVTALRTVWFKTAQYLHLRRIISTSSLVNYENFKHHEMLRFGFRAFGRFRVAPTGSGMQRGTDLIIQSRLASSKKHLKHHSRRLGFTWYEKKLWGYRKNHRY
jgi:hypothetical protein